MKKLSDIEKTIVAIAICFALFAGGSQLIEGYKNTQNAGNEASEAAASIEAMTEQLRQQYP